MNRLFRTAAAALLLAAMTASAQAERKTALSGSLGFVGAADSNPSLQGSGFIGLPDEGTSLAYSLFPSLELQSTGPDSQFSFSYALGISRFDSRPEINFESHQFGAGLETQLTRNLSMRLLDTFRRSPDFTSAALLSGIGFDPAQGFFFEFDTVAVRRQSTANTAVLSFDYTLDPRSSLTFGLGHSFRIFEDNFFFENELSDQNRFNAFLRYNRRLSTHTSWRLGFSAYHYDFKNFENTRTYDADIGLSHDFSPRLSLNVSAGPSFVDALQGGSDSVGYNASVSLAKTLDQDSFSLGYGHRSGASTGVGSVSNTHHISLAYQRQLSRRLTLQAQMSLYDTSARQDNPVSTQGVSAYLTASWSIRENWFVSVGGNILSQNAGGEFDLDRYRVFISMRYSLPNFWRF